MDLPVELRLLVEEELMAFDPRRPNKRLYSQILRTSRAIYTEAVPIIEKTLADGNMHVVRFRGNQNHGGHCYAACLDLAGCPDCSGVLPSSTVQLRDGVPMALPVTSTMHKDLGTMPPIPATSTRLLIDITCELPCPKMGGQGQCMVQPPHQINRLLYLLATQAPASNIVSISVRLNAPEEISRTGVLQAILWPLTKFGPNIIITTEGVPDELVSHLVTKQIESFYSLPAMTKWANIKAKADDLIGRVQQAGISGTGVQFLPKLLAATFTSLKDDGDQLWDDFERRIGDRVRESMAIWSSNKWQRLSAQADEVLEMKKAEGVEDTAH